MNKFKVALLTLFVFSLAVVFAGTVSAGGGGYSIRGMIKYRSDDQANGKGVANVTVKLYSLKDGGVATYEKTFITRGNENPFGTVLGEYKFEGLAPGKYKVVAYKSKEGEPYEFYQHGEKVTEVSQEILIVPGRPAVTDGTYEAKTFIMYK